MTLLDAHARVHEWLEDQAYDTLAALVQRDVARATLLFARWAAVFDEHMAWEAEHVLPMYRAVAPADGAGRVDHVEGDHVILARHVAAIREMLASLAALAALEDEGERASLREILEELPVVYRLIATLEHHTAREQTHVYSSVDVEGGERALAELVARARA